MRRRVLLLLITAALSILAVRSIAGHDRLAGHTLFAFTVNHGIDVGDLPVVLVWLVGTGCCAVLWRRS